MTWFLLALHILLIASFMLRILLRDDMRPDARMAWLTVIILVPYGGCALYYLFGEVALRRRGPSEQPNLREFTAAQQRQHPAIAGLLGQVNTADIGVDKPWQTAFDYAGSVNGFAPLAGNTAQLMDDGVQARAHMLADMDAAQHEINVLYYIWLDDQTGADVAQALIRAARRGVACRAMVDALGSRAFVRSAHWRQMRQAGVQLALALPINRPLKVLLHSRIDLRNHRKITLIDGAIVYCGSQNCADEAFAVKARYAPWVDIMLRMQGPVVSQMQLIFASDWAQASGQAYQPQRLLAPVQPQGFAAVAIAEGPNERPRATPHLVSTLIAATRHELVISTPYFVPDATVLEALCAAAWRGVQVILIVPARNDSRIVAAASRSTYQKLLRAGVHIHEFHAGLLHAKTLCVDGEVALVGSTNLDLRSFDLNFENNVLLHDRATTAAIRARQQAYMAQSHQVCAQQVRAWSWPRRIWNNLLATVSPLL